MSGLATLVLPPLAHADELLGTHHNTQIAVFAWLTLLIPLAGTVTIALLYRKLSERAAGIAGTVAIFLSFAAAVAMLLSLLGLDPDARHVQTGYDYANTLGLNFNFSLFIDPLSVFMCVIVSGVSALIHLYSIRYMASDRGYWRFFSLLNFFVFSMLLLVLAGNFILLIVGWAFVGAASYILIAFWYRRTTATAAGIKAFVINVAGDAALVLSAYLLFKQQGTLDIPHLLAQAQDPFTTVPNGTLTAAMLLLLVGAFAKSAQWPMHTWLPDAMEGPTPVSALIHAATMVTAGVYLIARFNPFFVVATDAALVGAIIGCGTLLMAASIALVQTDLKRIIAYSTISQIGYMIMGVCAAAYSAALFHLMTHAFFKALLFMAAGSVIAAMASVQDIDRMSGFRKAMPFTFATFTIGALTLAGLPPFSAFFSKDPIMSFMIDRGGTYAVLGVLGYVGALLTAFYAMRMVFRVFFGPECEEARELREGHLHHADPVNPATGESEDTDVGFPGADHHVAEREPSMKVAMGALAVCSVVAGVIQIPGFDDVVTNFLAPTFAASPYWGKGPNLQTEWIDLAIGAAVALAGIGGAWFAYVKRPGFTAVLQQRFSLVHRVLWNKYYFDEIFDFLIVDPLRRLGRFCNDVFEERVINELLVGRTTGIAQGGMKFVHALQNGLVRAYAALVVMGAVAMALYFYVVAR